MKRLIIFLSLILCGVAHSAQIVNVEYIHNAIAQKWDITVPYNSELTNPRVAANMKYLLTAVDVANELLNDEKTSGYGSGEYATTVVADTIAVDTAVDKLIDRKYKFFITTTADTDEFKFSISAAGKYYVDWGDGKTQIIEKPDTEMVEYSHPYSETKSYNIKFGGRATAYSDEPKTAAIKFYNNQKLAGIDGNLGRIFPTLANGTQPVFFETFMWCVNMESEIPKDLFQGIHGAPVEYMFGFLFYRCRKLRGQIPGGLFAGLSGAPVKELFHATFYETNLTGEIPVNLFAGIQGPPAYGTFGSTFQNSAGFTVVPAGLFAGVAGPAAPYTFASTFMNCTGLTTIPNGLFSGIYGAPTPYMFYATFFKCASLTSIPANLFGNISGTAQEYMFARMFYGCTSLTGASARINGKYLYNIWPNATEEQVGNAYGEATGLADYANIPSIWRKILD